VTAGGRCLGGPVLKGGRVSFGWVAGGGVKGGGETGCCKRGSVPGARDLGKRRYSKDWKKKESDLGGS